MDVLVCDTSGQVKPPPGYPDLTNSPIRCFDMAVDGQYGFIVVHFGQCLLVHRDALIELCFALKRNQHTRQIPILALLTEKHRVVLRRLAGAGVEYCKIVPAGDSRPAIVRDDCRELGPCDSPDCILQEMCPHLSYKVVSPQDEMVVCGVNRDRIILGGARLKKICETGMHATCEYHLKYNN